MDKKLFNECIKYFKSNKGFERLFNKTREKYISLGVVGGKIILNNLKDDEKEVLSGLLKKDYYSKKTAVIQVKNIEKALKQTKYHQISLCEILEGYFEENLVSKKEVITAYQMNKKDYFEQIVSQIKDENSYEWIKNTLNNKTSSTYKIFSKRYDENKDKLKKDILTVNNALNELPCKKK